VAPFIALVVVTLLARLAGSRGLGRGYLASLSGSLRAGVAAMFVLTGMAHFVGLRADLMKMVPPVFGNPGLWVTLTGLAELAGALGILLPATRRLASAGLALLLLAMFPANVYAALQQIPFGGEPATPLLQRSLEQLVYLAAVVWAGFGERTLPLLRTRPNFGRAC
jgi:uncharacterized membrane protein